MVKWQFTRELRKFNGEKAISWKTGCVLVAQSCPTLCNPMDYSPPVSSVFGILQSRTLECVAIPFSGDLPDTGIEHRAPTLQADSLSGVPPGKADFSIDHLVMSMCRILSCAVGRGCLLWAVCSLGKTLLAFALLHFVLQG